MNEMKKYIQKIEINLLKKNRTVTCVCAGAFCYRLVDMEAKIKPAYVHTHILFPSFLLSHSLPYFFLTLL